ncbi:MAG: beta-ketoacyl-ACP synthase III [Polyangiaceae bacterium]
MPNACVSGTGFYVPPRVVTNQMLADEYGIETSHEWIHTRTGIEERRFADEGVGTSELAAHAAEDAIARAGIAKTDVGMIILATLSPDCHFPGTGVYLQQRLGLAEGDCFAPALDIRNQCSGFVYGLSVAASMVQSGGVDNVLLVGAETHSHALDLTTRGRNVCSLFGDGAGAVIISATDEDRGVRGWTLGADGRYADELCQKIWDVSQKTFLPLDEQGRGIVEPEVMWAHMNGKVVFKHAVRRMIESLATTCLKLNVTRDDIDLFLFHQANLRINEHVQKLMEIPDEKIFHNIQRYGNTTAGTIPILLAEAERAGKLERGMKVACTAFGSGFTWGSAIIDW